MRLLEGIAVLFTDGYAQAAPMSHRAVQAFGGEELTMDEALRFSWLAAATAATCGTTCWDVLAGGTWTSSGGRCAQRPAPGAPHPRRRAHLQR